jgi:hypothetical protein
MNLLHHTKQKALINQGFKYFGPYRLIIRLQYTEIIILIIIVAL